MRAESVGFARPTERCLRAQVGGDRDAISSSLGDLDGSADVSRRVSVDVMRKPERYSLTLTCGTDYDGFAHPERRGVGRPRGDWKDGSGRDAVVSG